MVGKGHMGLDLKIQTLKLNKFDNWNPLIVSLSLGL